MKLSFTEVENYLADIKALIQCDQYQIDRNIKRPANRALFIDYVISEADAKNILLSLTPFDFSEVRKNEHVGREYELLYIFGKDVELKERFADLVKTVSLYIKFNKINQKLVVVISFHEAKYPLSYCFK